MGRKKKTTGTFDDWFSNYSQQNGIDISGANSSGSSYSQNYQQAAPRKKATFDDWFTGYAEDHNIDLTQTQQRQETPSYARPTYKKINMLPTNQQAPSYTQNPLVQAAQNAVRNRSNGYITGSEEGDRQYQNNLQDLAQGYASELRRRNATDPFVTSTKKEIEDIQNQITEIGQKGNVADLMRIQELGKQQAEKSKDLSQYRSALQSTYDFDPHRAYLESMDDNTLAAYQERVRRQGDIAQQNLAEASIGGVDWMARDQYMEEIDNTRRELGLVQRMLDSRNWNNRYQDYMNLRNQAGFDGSYQSTYNDTGERVDPRGSLNGAGDYIQSEMSKYGDITYDYLNNDPNAMQVMHTMNPYGFRTGDGAMNSYYAWLNDEEKQVFNHLYKQSPEQAYEFMDFMADELEKRERTKNEEYMSALADKDPVGMSMLSVSTALGAPIAAVSQLGSLAKDGEFDVNGWGNQFSYIPTTIRKKVSENIAEKSEVGSFLYNTGMSMADNFAQMAMTGGTSQAAVLLMMGTKVFADTVTEGVDQGKDSGEILLDAFVRSGIEVLTEKIGLDEVFDFIGGTRSIDQLLKSAAAEGGEEGLSDILNLVWDYSRQATTGKEADLTTKYNSYRLQGYSDKDAKGKVVQEFFGELSTDVLGGALSGFAMSGGGALVNDTANGFQYRELGKEIKASLPETSQYQRVGNRQLGEYFANMEQADAEETQTETEDIMRSAAEQLASPTESAEIEETSEKTTNESPEEENVPKPQAELRNQQIMAPLRMYSEAQMAEESERNYIDKIAQDRFGTTGYEVYRSALQNNGVQSISERMQTLGDFTKAYNAGMNNQAMPTNLRISEQSARAAYATGQNAVLDQYRDNNGKFKKGFTSYYGSEAGIAVDTDIVRKAVAEGLISQKDMDGFADLGVRLGTKIYLEETMPQNGWYENGGIAVALDADNGMRHVLSHEFVHRLQEAAPEEYETLKSYIADYIGSEDLERSLSEYYNLGKSQGISISQTVAMDEVVADWVAGHVVSGDLEWTGFVERASQSQEGRTFLQKIRDFFRNIVNKLKGSKNPDVIQLSDAMVKAQKLLDDTLNAAQRNVQNESNRSVSQKFIDAMDQTNQVIEDANGNPVAGFHEDGSVSFSLRSFDDSGRKIFNDYLNKLVKSGELLDTEADDMRNEMETVYKICKEFADTGKYAPFTAWSDAEVITDSKGRPVFSAIKKNSEYTMNVDFSTICKKRRTLDAVFREMINRGLLEQLDFNMDESAAMVVNINNLIRKRGFEAACALCFVEARRYRQQQTATTFRDMWNEIVESMYPDKSKIAYFNFGQDSTVKDVPDGIHTMDNKDLDLTYVRKLANAKNEKGKPLGTAEAKAARLLLKDPSQRKLMRVGDMMASTGFENMQIQNPQLMKVYNSKKGTGGAKSSFGDVQYLNEIVRSSKFGRRAAYAVSGVRIQSFSDYVPRMVFDYVQVIGDLAAKKLPAHAYTKEALFAKQFGLTGAKINLSLVPDVVKNGVAPGLDAKGNYVWNEEGTFPYKEAMELQQAEGYKENCGTIAVGISDEQIRKMLADPTIQMVIPYHKSSLNPIVAAMTNVDRFTNYEDSQNTKDQDGKTLSSKNDFAWDDKLFELTHDKNDKLLPRSQWGNVQDLVKEYVDWCDARGYTPKFSQFLYMEDGSINPGYYKLLEDFALLDNDGNFKPQGDVQLRFPTESDAFGSMASLIKQGLSEDTKLEKKRSAKISGIVDEIQTMINKGIIAENKRFSLRSKDAEYLELAKDPKKNEARLRGMVEQAAKESGFTVRAYHGTPFGGFTVFNTKRRHAGRAFGDGIYLTSSKEVADEYTAVRARDFDRIDAGEVPNYTIYDAYVKVADDALEFDLKNFTYKGRKVGPVGSLAMAKSEAMENPDKDIVIHNIQDGSEIYSTVYVIKDSSRIKSADLVTYDDNGNVIPLSERFNPENKDIRYSLRKDSSGKELSPAQAEYFKDSKILDEDGNLRVVYHGSSEAFNTFDISKGRSGMDIQGSFFSPWEIDAAGYGENVRAYYLNITNPAPEQVGYQALRRFQGQNYAGTKAREYLESLGYDGVNNGDEEYIAFYPEQIKLVDNQNPTNDKDVRYSLRGSRDIVAASERDSRIRNEYMEAAASWRSNMTALSDVGKSGFSTNMTALIRDYNKSIDKNTSERIVGEIRNLTREMVRNQDMTYSEISQKANVIAAKILWGTSDSRKFPDGSLLFNEDAARAVDDIRNDIMAQILKSTTRGEGKYQALSKEFADYRKRANDKITEVRRKRDAKLEEIQAKKREEIARKVDSSERTTLLKRMNRLNKLMKTTSEANQEMIRDFIGEFNLVAKSMTAGKAENLADLSDYIDNMMRLDPDFMPTERTIKDVARLGKKNVADLTIEEVAQLNEALLNLENAIRTSKRLIDSEYKQHISELGNEIIEGVRNTKGIANSKIGVFNWFQQTYDKTLATPVIRPETEILRLVGFDRNNPLYKLTFGEEGSLASGQKEMVRYKWQANKRYTDRFVNDKQFADSIMGKKARACEITGMRADGTIVNLKVTPDMLMALYMHAQNKHNFRHFGEWNDESGHTQHGGGITIPDFDLYRKGKIQEAYRVGTRDGNLITMTRSALNSAFKQLTEKEMSFIRSAQAYYSEMSQPEINRVSNLLLGYSIANEENYFRINTDSNYRGTNMDAIKFDGTIEGMGWTKERIEGARNAILLIPLTEQFQRDIDAHAKYIGMAIPVRNFNKAYGVNRQSYDENGDFTGTETSVQSAITGKWGSGATDYIQKLMSDVQNPQTSSESWTKIFGKLRSFYAGSVLALNAGVAIKQAASYPTAAAEIGWGPLIKAFGNTRLQGKMDMDLINKYSPLMYLRTQGMGYQELADLKNLNKGWLNRALNSKALNWIQDMDVMTVKKLWKAAEYYVRDNFKGLQVGSEEYYKKVGEVHSRVIERTQPNYTTLQRGEILRSDSDFIRMTLGMFKTQPFQNFSILFEATGELQAACRAYKVSPNEVTEAMRTAAVKKMARALSSQIVASLVFALMQAAWDWTRGRDDKYKDKEGRITFASAFKQIGINMGSNAFGMIPLGSVIYEAIETTVDTVAKNNGGEAIFNATAYGLDASTATGIVNDLVDAVQSLTKISTSVDLESKNTTEQHVRGVIDILSSAVQAAGYPADNFVKDGQAVAVNVFRLLGATGQMSKYEQEFYSKRIFTAVSKDKKGYLEILYNAYDNDADAYNKLYSIYTENDGFATSSKTSKEYIDDKMNAHIKEQTKNQNRDKAGLTESQLNDYQEALDRFDANRDGSYTQEETYNALMSIALSQKQKETLWNERGWQKSFSEYKPKK